MAEKKLDNLFLCLLLVEAAMTVIFLADIGLGQPFGHTVHLAFNFSSSSSLPTVFASGQLLLIGTVFALVSRRLPAMSGPSRFFLLVAGGLALLLVLLILCPQALLAENFPGGDNLPWPGPALLGAGLVLNFGRRSLRVMWRFYPVASLIMLAGLWILLFGAVGVDILDTHFFRCAKLFFVKTALEKFLEMAGASVILYGAALFAQQMTRLKNLRNPARC